ncbi:MAG: hypothetical protein QXT92_00395 [Nitrososphaerota archaeon]
MNSWRKVSSVLAVVLLLTLPTALAVEQETAKLSISVRGHREYFNTAIGDYTYYQSFYMFGGKDVQWWQGGAVFEYYLPNEVAKQKIDMLTKHLMGLFKDLGFIIVAGTVKPTYVRIVYWFDGVLLYEGLYFVDGDGTVIVEWSEGKPLTITINSIAIINASTAQYLGKADWKFIEMNGGTAILEPELTVEAPVGDYEFLVVPREGVAKIDTSYNYYHNASKTVYLGGGPELHHVKVGEKVYGNVVKGYDLSDSGIFYGRDPALKIVYDEKGRRVYKVDWFWSTEILVSLQH